MTEALVCCTRDFVGVVRLVGDAVTEGSTLRVAEDFLGPLTALLGVVVTIVGISVLGPGALDDENRLLENVGTLKLGVRGGLRGGRVGTPNVECGRSLGSVSRIGFCMANIDLLRSLMANAFGRGRTDSVDSLSG